MLPVMGEQIKQPNVIFVMPDDAGYGDYSIFGNPIIKTPAVDAFVKQGLLLTQFHVSPACAPTRAALMLGRHEFRSGVTHTISPRDRPNISMTTLAQMLQSSGYTTGIFGKWHLGDEEAYRPESRGFDEVFIHGTGGIGQHADAPGNHNVIPPLWHNNRFVQTEGYCTDLFFEQATKWMDEKRQGNQPFFAYITPNAPHAPHDIPENYYEHYVEALKKNKMNPNFARYCGMVANIDTNFGKLLKQLDQWQMGDDTIVIFLGSDNGGTTGVSINDAGMKGKKMTPYQGGTRVPFVIRWPDGGVPAGVECDALTSIIDMFPTLSTISGATLSDELQKQLEGRNLVPLLEDPKAAWADRYLVHHVGRWWNGVTAEQSKYINCAIQNSRFTLVDNTELYDLEKDPGETTNVISEHPEVVSQLRAEYDKWWQATLPMMVNESVKLSGPSPFVELYVKQYEVIDEQRQRRIDGRRNANTVQRQIDIVRKSKGEAK
jgi:arylsulfatase A-like enzyme